MMLSQLLLLWQENNNNNITLWRNTLLIIAGVIVLRKIRDLYAQARRKRHLPVANIPYVVPNPHWLFGHLLQLHGRSSSTSSSSSTSTTWLECQQHVFCEHAGGNRAHLSTFWISHRPGVSALDANTIQYVLGRCDDRIPIPAIRKHYVKLLGENTLVFARGKEWKDMRKMVHTAFVDQALQHAQKKILQMSWRIEQAMIQTCSSSSSSSSQQQHQDQPSSSSSSPASPASSSDDDWHVEAYQFCKMATLDVFGMAALGYDFGCSSTGIMTSEQQHSSIFAKTEFLQSELIRRCFEERFNIFAQCYWIPTPRNLRHQREIHDYKKLLLSIVQARRAKLDEQEETKRRLQPEQCERSESNVDISSDEDETCSSNNDNNNSGNKYDCGDNLTLLDFLLRGPVNNKDKKKGCASSMVESMSDQYIAEFLMSAVFGGYDSTALALSYTLYLLAVHPDHQDRCAEEAKRVLGESGTTHHHNHEFLESFLATTDLPYCHAAVLESLRYYPPIAVTSRDLTKPISLELHVDPDTGKSTMVEIPAGVRFMVPFYCVNHSEINYPRPDEYIPERWVQRDEHGLGWHARTAENDQGEPVPRGNEKLLITFSAGARSCAGRPLATRMITTLAAVMVRSFHIELADPNYEMELQRFGLNQVPRGGIPLILRRRETPLSS